MARPIRPQPSSLLPPTRAAPGAAVVIVGANFADATSVAFNGEPAVFTVDSPAQVTAIVPANAGSGFLSVTTPSGTAISTSPFAALGGSGVVYRGTLAAWDFSSLPGGLANFGPSPFPPAQTGVNAG